MKRNLARVVCMFAAAGLVLALPGGAWAKAKKAAPTAEKPAAAGTAEGAAADDTKVKVERGAGGKKIYKIQGDLVIEGKIQKPEAFYVLQKSSINYDWHELRQDFLPRILDSVSKAPF